VVPQAELSGLRQPSMAGVLEAVAGPWGAKFISAGLLVSVLGAYLAWSLLAAEMLFAAAKSGTVPKILAGENRNRVPAAALWLTNILVQLFLTVTLFAREAFDLALSLTSAKTLIPCVLVAAFALKLAWRGETYEHDASDGERRRDLVFAGLATLYTIFMLIAGGLKYVLLSAIIFAPGTILFVIAKREQGRPLFTPVEWALFAAVVAGAAIGVYGLATGTITI
jgi:arginine:ornithine antiporter / lysine permease